MTLVNNARSKIEHETAPNSPDSTILSLSKAAECEKTRKRTRATSNGVREEAKLYRDLGDFSSSGGGRPEWIVSVNA